MPTSTIVGTGMTRTSVGKLAMGVYDFWWNTVQEGKLADLQKENERLQAEIDQLTVSLNAWVQHFNAKIEKLENERAN